MSLRSENIRFNFGHPGRTIDITPKGIFTFLCSGREWVRGFWLFVTGEQDHQEERGKECVFHIVGVFLN